MCAPSGHVSRRSRGMRMMMRGTLRKHIPSMFHRRLLLLAAAGVVMALILGAQALRLGVGPEHSRRRAAAERALQETHPIPTVRGRILDRYDRPLAVDEPGYEVAVKYAVICGEWAYRRARAAARAQDRERWKELDSLDQQALTDVHLPSYQKQVQEMW